MKIVCLTDIHGYLDRAKEALELLEDETGIETLEDGEWSSEHTLVLNGDMFDRGPRNRESLEWALDQDEEYIVGNHEFFAMFPDVAEEFVSEAYLESAGSAGLYWRDMDEGMRSRLLESAMEGDLKAAYRGHEFTYSHSGSDQRPDVEKLNRQLSDVGEKLYRAHRAEMNGEEDAFEEAQKDIVWVEEDGGSLNSRYPEIFSAERDDEGGIDDGGVVWKRFHGLETDYEQVVGHTKGSDMLERGYGMNPQWRGRAVNLNTIRDSAAGDSGVAVSVEDEEGLEVYEFSV